jgi:peroxiredoxin Q/BCP
MLAPGASVPELTGLDQHGQMRRLRDAIGHPLLVYFYPKDGTPGCTKEACAFRDVWQRYQQAGVVLYGVSRDDRAAHAQFAEKYHLDFPLIADVDGTWAAHFGVPIRFSLASRVSFLFNAQGQLAHVYPKVDPGVHATDVLRDIAALH